MLYFVVDFRWHAVCYVSEAIESTRVKRNLSECR
jgi:hypothetical protein